MCGIVGYVGRQPAVPLIVEGLSQLEYRGYDSAGVAVIGPKGLRVAKRAGSVSDLEAALRDDSPARSDRAHPVGHARPGHRRQRAPASGRGRARRGRAQRHHRQLRELREQLTGDGVKLASDTDTEVIAHLIAARCPPRLEGAVLEVLDRIDGTYGLAVMHVDHPDRIVVARNGSPLIIGVGDREMHVASDVAALVRYTRQVVHLDDGELATVTADGFTTFTRERAETHKEPTTIDVTAGDLGKGDFEHYMLKEILEQPAAAERVFRGRLDARFGTAHLGGLNLDARETRAIKRVKILGCGSAYYAGQLGATLIEDLAGSRPTPKSPRSSATATR